MKDSAFQKLLDRAAWLSREHASVRLKLYDEFMRRYGKDPADHDADEIIDGIDYGQGITVERCNEILGGHQGC